MANVERSLRLFESGNVAEALLRRRGLKHSLLGVQHTSYRGTVNGLNAHWLTEGVDMRRIVEEQLKILERFPADKVALSVSHESRITDKNNSSPRDYEVSEDGVFSYSDVSRLYGGRKPYWLRFFCVGSIDLFWGNGSNGEPEEISVSMPAGNEMMLEHIGDLLSRTSRFGTIVTEKAFLEMVSDTRNLLSSSLQTEP